MIVVTAVLVDVLPGCTKQSVSLNSGAGAAAVDAHRGQHLRRRQQRQRLCAFLFGAGEFGAQVRLVLHHQIQRAADTAAGDQVTLNLHVRLRCSDRAVGVDAHQVERGGHPHRDARQCEAHGVGRARRRGDAVAAAQRDQTRGFGGELKAVHDLVVIGCVIAKHDRLRRDEAAVALAAMHLHGRHGSREARARARARRRRAEAVDALPVGLHQIVFVDAVFLPRGRRKHLGYAAVGHARGAGRRRKAHALPPRGACRHERAHLFDELAGL